MNARIPSSYSRPRPTSGSWRTTIAAGFMPVQP
jgi:hypothetical protein